VITRIHSSSGCAGFLTLVLAGLVVLAAGPANAQNEELQPTAPASITREAQPEVDALRVLPPPADTPRIPPPAELRAAPAPADVLTRLAGGALFSTQDKEHSFRVGGRLHFDAAYYLEDGEPMQNGVRVRRSRLGVAGRVYGNWDFQSEFDFAENAVESKDLWIQYAGWPVNIRAGHFKAPFSLEELTSSNSYTFIERALPVAFAPSYRLGLGVASSGDRYTAAAMVYGRAIGEAVAGDQPVSGGARLTFLPILKKDRRLVHVGLAGTLGPTDTANSVRFRQRPESRVDGARFVDTGDITRLNDGALRDPGALHDVGAVGNLGAELAWIEGSFRIQGEYMHTEVLRKNDLENLQFNGYYAQASYVFGGTYAYREGVMRGVTPRAGGGACELAVRYSHIGLNDDVILGGEISAATLGINYYANAHIRLMANYGLIFTDDQGPRTDNPMILQTRLQIAF
jgi:phosphate-selective porin OprO and OprP